MASISDTTTSSEASANVTAHTVDLAGGTGGVVVASFFCERTGVSVTWPTGWTKIAEDSGGSRYGSIAYNDDGTDVSADSIEVTTSIACESAHTSWRVQDGDFSDLDVAVNNDTSATPDVGTVTIDPGPKDFVGIYACGGDDNRSVTAYPLADNQETHNTGGGGTRCFTGSCTAEYTNQDDFDPSAFTINVSDKWVALFVAIADDSGGGTTVTTPAEIGSVTAYDAPALTQTHQLAPAQLVSVSVLDAPTVTPTVTVSPSSVFSVTAGDNPALVQEHQLLPAALFSASEFDAPTVTTGSSVAPANIFSLNVFDNPAVIVPGSVSPNSIASPTQYDAPALTQTHQLAPAEFVSVSVFDHPAASVKVTARPDDLASNTELEPATLTQTHGLTANVMFSATTFGVASLVVTLSSIPQDSALVLDADVNVYRLTPETRHFQI